MAIIYKEQDIIKHTKHIHASNKNIQINGKKKEYLLHERALLMKEYFRNQRSLFTSLKSKIIYLQKGNSGSKSL